MQGEFEKKIQERMQTFGMPPSPQVWEEVNAVLGKRKHRRVFIGWWILLGLVVATGGILLYNKETVLRNGLELQPAINNDTAHTNNNSLAKKSAADTSLLNATAKQLTTSPSTPSQKNTGASQTISSIYNRTIKHTSKAVAATKQGNMPQAGSIVPGKNQSSLKNGEDITPQQVKEPPVIAETSSNLPLASAQQQLTRAPGDDQIKNDVQSGQQPSAPAGAQVTTQAQSPEKQTNTSPKTTILRRHEWFLRLSAGVMQTRQNSLLGSGDKSLAAATPQMNYANILALTAPAAIKYDIQSPGAGFALSASFVYQYKLSSQWQVYGSLGAVFLANTQKTGALYDQAFNLNNGLFSGGSNSNVQYTYYQGGEGNTNTVINKAWQLQAQAGVNYIINPRAKTKFFVDAGLSGAWMLSSRWLIPDARYGKLYYNKQVLNNTIIGWQAGTGMQFKNNIKLGIGYQQSFTSLAKSYVEPRLKWENVNIYTAVPFSLIASKKQKH
ncbi:MAG TPA: hypothetical protein VHB48_03150 [Chitinophagaceae bacterium]|nr:hypothetical protein [Chitinophagaceae bacterium]